MRTFHEYNIEQLKNINDAAEYLAGAIADFEEDHNLDFFLKAIRDVAEAQGGLGKLANRTHLNRQNLYKILSAKRQPRLDTFSAILDGLGLQISIIPKTENGIRQHL